MKYLAFIRRAFLRRLFIVAGFQAVFFLLFTFHFSNPCAGVEAVSPEDQLKGEVTKDPDSIKGHLALASFYLNGDEFAKAEESFKQALGINPSEVSAFDGLGLIYLRKDDTFASLDKAIKLFSRATEIDPKSGKALAHWAEAVAERSRASARYAQKKAILEALNRALGEASADVDVYQSAIACCEILGKGTYDEKLIDQATALYAKALALDPKAYGARTSLARIRLEQGDGKEVARLLSEAAQVCPRRSDAYRILAKLYAGEDMQTPAENAAKKAIEINPNKGEAYAVLAKIYAAQGKTTESDKMIKLLLALSPWNINNRLEVVSFYFANKDYANMSEALDVAFDLNAKNGEAYLWRARLALAQGYADKAEESFRKAVELSPKNEKAFAEFGAFYQSRGDSVNAQACFQKASELGSVGRSVASSSQPSTVDDLRKKLRLDPRDQGASVALASIYVKQGKLVDAEGLLAYVIRLNPKNDEALAEMGWLELGRKNKARAKDSFLRALRSNPRNKTALRGMQSLS